MKETHLEKFDVKQWYLSNFELFENRLDGNGKIPFHDTRRTAISRFSDLGFPTPRNEEWKYTNLAPLLAHKFQVAMEPVKLTKTLLNNYIFDEVDKNVLVFVNGHFSEELSTFDAGLRGVVVESLRTALLHRSEIVQKHLGRYATFEKEAFTALNTAFTYDGALLYVPEGTIIEDPIHFVNVSGSTDAEIVSHPRNLFVVGKGSQIKILDSYHYLSENTYFNNIVTEVLVDENAVVDHIKIQEESKGAFHIATTQVQQERSSVYTSINIDLGGALVRNNLSVLLNGENCETHLFGFYFGEGTQHIDNHTFMDHAKPHCFSNELYKGILGGKARGVFNGKIMVRPNAQKTNALQSNKTLLLSDEAAINAKPQLEIFADDVKCTHGATIGQVDEEAMFYLRSRGISEEMVSAMLRFAFAADVFEKIEIEPVREKLDTKIIDILKRVQES